MDGNTFDALTRRAPLLALAAAGLASLGSPGAAAARKKRKKGDVNALCKPQVSQCLAFYLPQCSANASCLARFNLCCPEFGTCDFSGFFDCLRSTQSM